MEGDPLPSRSYDHVSFKIEDTEYERRLQQIRSVGLDVREGRQRIDGEGRSIYFHDCDHGLFELHTGTLSERPASYAQVKRSS